MTGHLITAGWSVATDLALTWLIQSTVLLAAGLAAGRILRRWGPAVQSALYRTTLAAVLLCPGASLAMAVSGFNGLLIRLPGASGDDRPGAGPAEPSGRPSRAIAGRDDPPTRFGPDRLSVETGPRPAMLATVAAPAADPGRPDRGSAMSVGAAGAAESARSARAHDRASTPTELIGRTIVLVVSAWLLGALALTARLAVGHRHMARIRSDAIAAEPEAEALCREQAQRMRLSAPAVLRSPFLSSPCLDGLRRPAILLPEDTTEDLRETFVHELAHLARRDGLWNLLRQAATAALWPQPLLWLLSRRIEATAEEVCDDCVVAFGADRARYATLLLELAQRRLPPLAPAGVGMIALRSLLARRIARVLDSTRVLSTRAGARAVAATLLAGLIGTLLAGTLGVGGGDREGRAEESKAGKSATAADPARRLPDDSVTPTRKAVRGQVVDPDGKPVAGSTVTAARFRKAGVGPYGEYRDRRELGRTLADAEGRFHLTLEGIDPAAAEDPDSPDRWSMPLVVASAPSFGPAWAWIDPAAGDQALRLARDDVPITGRVVDLEGRPVAGVSVRLDILWQSQGTVAVENWLKAVDPARIPPEARKPRFEHFPAQTPLPGNEPAASIAATTDAQGRFRLTGLGRDRLAQLEVVGPTVALRRVGVVTRPMRRVGGPPRWQRDLNDPAYYGAECTIAAEPGRPIEGVVRDAETRAPIPGAIVTAMQLAGSLSSIEGIIAAVADARGRYRLVGLPKASGHRLSVYPPLDRPYFTTEFLEVPAGPGLGPVPFDIELKRGLWIIGRVADSRTGRPVQAAIHYYPFLANANAKGYRNFDANRYSVEWTGTRYRTDADGRFRVVGLPGRGILAAKSFDLSYRLGVGGDSIPEWRNRPGNRREGLPTYNEIHPQVFHALAEIDPPAGAAEFRRDLALEPTPSLAVRLVDPEGRPLSGAAAWGRVPAHLGSEDDHNLYDRSRTRVVGLDPTQPRTVVFRHHGRKLGAVLVIEPAEAAQGGERTVMLRPCATVTGRVVDADGKPVTGGVQVILASANGRRATDLWLPPEPIGDDGRFRIDELAPGAIYQLRAKDRLALSLPMKPEQFREFDLARDLKADPGQVIDLGTYNAATGRRVKAPADPLRAGLERPVGPRSRGGPGWRPERPREHSPE
jgi:beta-lactamase regulating signal transducer with metallopeptidase domain/protocatechuate 3,4-dioxygenase beta subunit